MVSCKSKIAACVTDIDSWMIINLRWLATKQTFEFFSSSHRPRPALDLLHIVSGNVRCSTTAVEHLGYCGTSSTSSRLCASLPFFICVVSSRSVSSYPFIQPRHLSTPSSHSKSIIAIHSTMVNLNVLCETYNVFWTVLQDSFIQQVNLSMSHLCFLIFTGFLLNRKLFPRSLWFHSKPFMILFPVTSLTGHQDHLVIIYLLYPDLILKRMVFAPLQSPLRPYGTAFL